ncbi:MAG TPA: phosphatidylethanolamine-binding protein [Rhodospirillaceae bacterium]|nr:phosphatidylethanolamine-binding protein [Rhodospirillaceae bacterium]
MKLEISGLNNGDIMPDAQVFNGFGCSGENISPELKFSDIPAGTKSLALTVYDPDAPTGSGWWHWVIFNIKPDTKNIAAGASGTDKMPTGAIESITDYGAPGYGGACPPEGDKPHRYIFTLFALSVDALPLDAKAMPAMVGFYLNQNALAKSEVTLHYGR